MYAIVEDSGTQIRMSDGDVIEVDTRTLEEGQESISFDRVLLLGEEGKPATIGTPLIEGACVKADVIEQFRDRKIDVIKFKRRKGYRVKRGHRQSYLRIRVTAIEVPGGTAPKKSAAKKPAAKKPAAKKPAPKKAESTEES